jgi:molybdate transport system permease protein
MGGTLALAVTLAVGAGFLVLPLVALLLRVPYDRLGDYLTRPIVRDALLLSLGTSLLSLALVIAFGTPLAYVLARYAFRGKRALETLVELPLVLPPAVAGVALLLAFGRRGLLGPWLEEAGLEIAFSTAAVVLAQAFVAAPLYIGAARSSFAGVSREWEEVAQIDGAGRWARFWQVLLPLALPGVLGGVAMGWARTLGEFGATLLFAGSFAGRTQTMPLAIYSALESDLDAAILLSAILVAASFTLLLAFKALSGRPGASQ